MNISSSRALHVPRRLASLTLALVASAILSTSVRAQEPYDEDEWYDPTDWFDGNNIEWDDSYEWWDEGRTNDGYDPYSDYDYYDGYDTWDVYDPYDPYTAYDPYDQDGYGYDAPYWADQDRYGWHYEWDPIANEWDHTYGAYDDYYDYEIGEPSYGWHYEWDSDRNRWNRTYGWYDEYYEYPGETVDSSQGSGQRNQQGQRSDRRDQQNQGRSQQNRSQTGQRQSQQNRGTTQLTGRVQSFNRVRGASGDRTLVRIELQDGRSRFVDFGTNTDLGQLGLERGDQVRISGRTNRTGGREVLRATSVSIDGERTRIRRQQQGMSGQPERSTQQRADQQRRTSDQGKQDQGKPSMSSNQRGRRSQQGTAEVTFSGELAGFGEVTVRGRQDPHLLVRMRMQDGQWRIVDLGPTPRLGQLDLEKGDRVTVHGHTQQANGRTVLMADRLRVDGRQVAIGSSARRSQNQNQNQIRYETQTDSQSQSPPQSRFAGRIDSVRRVEGQGSGDNLLLSVQLEDGTKRVVDFGRSTTMDDLDLSSGDRIQIVGRNQQRDGERVFVAREVHVNGQPLNKSDTSGGMR